MYIGSFFFEYQVLLWYVSESDGVFPSKYFTMFLYNTRRESAWYQDPYVWIQRSLQEA